MKIALWIHVATQTLAVSAFEFYLRYFQDLLHYGYGINFRKTPMPAVVDLVFRFHLALWLLPLAALIFAVRVGDRQITADRYAIFSASSVLAVTALAGLAMLVSVTPFLHLSSR